MLITDSKKLKYYGEKNFKKNIKFRAFLKAHDIEDAELDAIVHELYNEIAGQISCGSCARCCEDLDAEITPEDKKRIAGHLGISENEFEQKYLRSSDDDFYLNKHPCPFFIDKKCSITEVRPEICRTFPNLSKKDFRSRLFQVIENYSICPIVFNVFERLKAKFDFKDYNLDVIEL
jgi:hypothetical protein